MTEFAFPVLVPVDNAEEATAEWTVPPRPGLLTPTAVTVRWRNFPEVSLARALDEGVRLEAEPALGRILALADALVADHLLGNAVLASWSLRHDEQHLVVAGAAPGLSDGTSPWDKPFDDPPDPGPGRDLYMLGVALFRVLSGRWPASRRDAVEAAGVLGGEWPPGAGLAVRLCLHPDPGRAAATADHLLDVVRAMLRLPVAGEELAAVVAQESVTGWRKAHGRPGGDNEDGVLWRRLEDHVVGMVVDGVSGHSDGAGQVAAKVLCGEAEQAWREGVLRPDELILRCDAALRQEAGEPDRRPAATAVAFALGPFGRLDLASVGDSPAFLCRPTTRGVAVARLNTEHSRVADRLRAGAVREKADKGVVTMACGVGAPLRPHTTSLNLQPGDRLVVTTDGATKADADDGGERCFAFMDTLADTVMVDPYPALLASLLCRRADDLGGYDNATVLVVGVTGREDPTAMSAPVSGRVRSVATGLA